MIQPPPSLDCAYNILLNDEKQRQVQSNSQFNPESMSFNVSIQIKPGFGFNPSATSNPPPPRPYAPRINFYQNRAPLFCKYYKKSGHLVKKYYKLHGYPQSPKFNKGKRAISHVSTATHTNSECSVFKSAGTLDEGINAASNVDVSDSNLCLLTQNNYVTSIIDSDASDHMTSNKELLFDITPLTIPYLVTLPNGYKVKMPLDLGKEEDGLYKFTWVQPSDSSIFSSSNSCSIVPICPVVESCKSIFPSGSKNVSSYPFAKKGYKLYNLASKKCFVFRDVIFHETYFPFVAPTSFVPSSFLSFLSSHVLYQDPMPSLPHVPPPSPFSPDLSSFSGSSSLPPVETEPFGYSQAASVPAWQDAMRKKFDALDANHTWDIVYKIKYKADESVERYKARLVIRGDTHVEGVDFTETFSPVIKMSTVKCLVVVVIKHSWSLSHLDVNNAFIHGDLDEEVYIKLPQGLTIFALSGSAPLVCKLRKSLYGLRKVSRQWYAKLSQALYSRGYTYSLNDYSLFIKGAPGNLVLLAVYVDDIIITGDDIAEISALTQFLDAQFKIKDLGSLHYFLGIEVSSIPGGVILNQKKFVTDLLQQFDCNVVSPVVCPLELNCKLHADTGDLLHFLDQYRSLVGKLIFLTHTRSDICFVVQHLSQFLKSPRVPHMTAALHVLRYLKGTVDLGLFYSSSPDFSIYACIFR
uniref:Reverse transcriptase Ty1/copia-type domain-containing protein n=1 Tax=Nicotiana tabacum TaxID=4097 RepID=A0A1S4CLH4_TOBAC|nr:PREDICTED: uncharacterized protein LOC107820184 [Nicotiana tabacum]